MIIRQSVVIVHTKEKGLSNYLRHVITSPEHLAVYLECYSVFHKCVSIVTLRAHEASIVTLTWNTKDTFSVSKCGSGSCNSSDSHCHQPTDWLTPLREWKLNHNVTLSSLLKRARSVLPLPVLRLEWVDFKDVVQMRCVQASWFCKSAVIRLGTDARM